MTIPLSEAQFKTLKYQLSLQGQDASWSQRHPKTFCRKAFLPLAQCRALAIAASRC